ncbi:MAG: 5-formyltetrahydrofolate cyclo-ligase, partial [Oscillospiraceae bacterium]|jgi:5-formyltetrahydrofolate cyclo-ligase|nr:5-formyltetrahydrofolate cyclo-ligase [Oscillospiraceae bacterium]
VSTAIEVDTHAIIREALERGKTVAVPRCVDGTRDMDFFVIRSLHELEKGSFGVMEPNPETCEKLPDYQRGLCIVPALAFDKEGFRLGYGKGYYDRFLSLFKGETLGLCYADCFSEKPLPHGKYDKRVSLVITENTILTTE